MCPFPDYQSLILPLKLLGDGEERRLRDLVSALEQQFGLTQNLHPSDSSHKPTAIKLEPGGPFQVVPTHNHPRDACKF